MISSAAKAASFTRTRRTQSTSSPALRSCCSATANGASESISTNGSAAMPGVTKSSAKTVSPTTLLIAYVRIARSFQDEVKRCSQIYAATDQSLE
ncbi:hypothetical protein D3C75_674630 [compost metagenome]